MDPDKGIKRLLSAKQKALQINLDQKIYGTFAEIGAGQEVVRYFFRAGGASGTVAKAMSAYDKDFSDAIYGKEKKGRYVCEPRLKKMLDHEYSLIEERLDRKDHPDKVFFSYANTVTTINYQKTVQGHGWMGIRFQQQAGAPSSEIVLHIHMHETDAAHQGETIGMMGVNLIYGAFKHCEEPVTLLKSLYDNIDKDKIEIDMVQFSGPVFKEVDNRLMSLQLVKLGMTDAVIFGHDGSNLHPSEVLYKKNILAIRGSFRPVTKVNIDMITNGFKAFTQQNKVRKDRVQVLFEITLNNLSSEGDIDEQDFLDRADILCSLGQTVLISNYQEYYKLVRYLSRYTRERMGLIMGVNNLMEIFKDKYYRDLEGGILEAFGILNMRDIKIFLYPSKDPDTQEVIHSGNLQIHPRLKPLYDALTFNQRIIDLEGFNLEILHIWSREVLRYIRKGLPGWEDMVPTYVDNIIKEKKLFGYTPPKTKPEKADAKDKKPA